MCIRDRCVCVCLCVCVCVHVCLCVYCLCLCLPTAKGTVVLKKWWIGKPFISALIDDRIFYLCICEKKMSVRVSYWMMGQSENLYMMNALFTVEMHYFGCLERGRLERGRLSLWVLCPRQTAKVVWICGDCAQPHLLPHNFPLWRRGSKLVVLQSCVPEVYYHH